MCGQSFCGMAAPSKSRRIVNAKYKLITRQKNRGLGYFKTAAGKKNRSTKRTSSSARPNGFVFPRSGQISRVWVSLFDLSMVKFYGRSDRLTASIATLPPRTISMRLGKLFSKSLTKALFLFSVWTHSSNTAAELQSINLASKISRI